MKTLATVSQCSSCRHLRSWVVGGDGTTCAAYPDGIPDALWDNGVDHRGPLAADGGVQWVSNGEPFPAWAFDDDAAAGERSRSFVGERVGGGPQWIGQDRDRRGRWTDGPRASLMGAKTAAEVGVVLASELQAGSAWPVSVDFEDADVQIAREYAEGILRAAAEFPNAPLTRVGMTDDDLDDGDGIAKTVPDPRSRLGTTAVILFDRQFSASREAMDAALAEGRADGWFSERAGPMWFGAHEFAHVVTGPPLHNFASAKTADVVAGQMEAEGLDSSRGAVARNKYITSVLSEMATDHPDELVSEALADVLVGGDDAAPVSRSIVDVLKAEYAAAGAGQRSHRPRFVREAGGKHYKLQLRDPGGKDGGRWVTAGAFLGDLLDLPDPRTDLVKLRLPDLKMLLGYVGQSPTGNKGVLVDRIAGHVKGKTAADFAEPSAKAVKATKAKAAKAAKAAAPPSVATVRQEMLKLGTDDERKAYLAGIGIKSRAEANRLAKVLGAKQTHISIDATLDGIVRYFADARSDDRPATKAATKDAEGAPFNPRRHGEGTRVYWDDDQDGKRIYGTVGRMGRFTTIDWEGGRREKVDAGMHLDIRLASAPVLKTLGAAARPKAPASPRKPAAAKVKKKMSVAEANRLGLRDVIDEFAEALDNDEVGAQYREIRDKVAAGEWNRVQARKAAKAAGKFWAKASGAALEGDPDRMEKSSRYGKAWGDYDNLGDAIVWSPAYGDRYLNPQSWNPVGLAGRRLGQVTQLPDGTWSFRHHPAESSLTGPRVDGFGSRDEAVAALRAYDETATAARKVAADESLRPDGRDALGEVPADRIPGDDGVGAGDVLHAPGGGDLAGDRGPDAELRGDGTAGGDVHGEAATPEHGEVDGAERDLTGDAAPSGGGRGDGVTPPIFRPSGQADLAPSGEMTRLRANMDALRTLRRIQAEDRPATADEQAVLARWSGWGAIPNVFDSNPAKPAEWERKYGATQRELHTLLDDAEYAAAARSILNAHYTDVAYVDAMWDALGKLGFTEGRVLEPGSGSGNFMGRAPEGTEMVGVELDPITAGISAALYPNATVRNESFADTRLPDGSFDAAVGNVPFADVQLDDPRHNAGKHSMHNHFILKSLALTRPGGMVAVLTSRYSLDNRNPAARREMAALGDLVGAVRLPSGAHRKAAGTEVVTDLLIFRRREPGAEPAGLPFEQTRIVDVGGTEIAINEVFIEAPDLVLGKFDTGGMLRADDLTVIGDTDAGPALRKALSKIVGRAKADGLTMTASDGTSRERLEFVPLAQQQIDGYLRANDDGTFSRLTNGVAVPQNVPAARRVELRHLMRLRDLELALLDEETTHADDTETMVRLRADLNTTYDTYLAKYGPINRHTLSRSGRKDPETGEDIMSRRSHPAMVQFRDDPHAPGVTALEDYDPVQNTTTKADIFRGRVVAPPTPRLGADTAEDALAITLDQHGRVWLGEVARLLGVSKLAARAQLGELVYDDPDTKELVPAAEYLSGNVRVKLDAARLAAVDDPLTYQPNVAALERALPPDLEPGEIKAKLGATWIDPEVMAEFLRDILEDYQTQVVHDYGSQWTVSTTSQTGRRSVASTSKWGIPDRNGYEIAESLMTQRSIKVYDSYYDDDGTVKRILNPVKTEAANDKAREMAERFAEWAWEDPRRSDALATEYNRVFNSLVLRTYGVSDSDLRALLTEHGLPTDGDSGILRARLAEAGVSVPDPELPGISLKFDPHPHVRAAVARVINESSVGLWHEVGAGKTTVMTIGAMELRRLGMARKPAIVVPNHMLEQFRNEFIAIYPQAHVLAAGSDDMTGDGRKKFIAKAATGDWDAVIITKDAFRSIPASIETQEAYLAKEVAEFDAALDRARTAARNVSPYGSDRKAKETSVKRIEKAKQKAEIRIKANIKKAKKTPGISFEQTGIDYLFVDEAHQYKNLRRTSAIEGLSQLPGSGIATDLDMKIGYLRDRNPHHVVTLATATPIANSMGEAHTMMHYLRPDLLESLGIKDFDTFVAQFGEPVTGVEPAPEGGLRTKSRIAKFVNLPELLRPWGIAGDVKTAEDLEHIVHPPKLRPNADGERIPEIVIVPPSEELKAKMAELKTRAEKMRARGGKPQKGDDNMLNITSEGRAAALDLRLVGRSTPERTKLDYAADNIIEIWKANQDRVYDVKGQKGTPHPTPGALQIVFADLGTPKTGSTSTMGPLVKAKDITSSDLRVTDHAASRAGTLVGLAYDDDGEVEPGVYMVRWDGDTEPSVESLGGTGLRHEVTEKATRFDAYDALRKKLMSQGMPRDKIRFIHDAKNAKEKLDLYDAANDGRISVLIGSTEMMGTGVNVQTRAVALHHLDVPWRPADVQQREGRIIRQKNQNPEIRILRYVAERSFDDFMWKAVARKAKFINQMMRGKLDVREMEDIGDFALSADTAAALAGGNPRLIEHAAAQGEVTRLERLQRAHENNLKTLRYRVNGAKQRIAESEHAIADLDAIIARRVETRGDKFRMTVADVEYDNRDEATTALRERLQQIGMHFYGTRTVGSVGGFAIKAKIDHGATNLVTLELQDVPYSAMFWTEKEIESADLSVRLENKLVALDRDRALSVANIEQSRHVMEKAEVELRQPFKHKAALRKAQAVFAELDEEIRAEAAANDAASHAATAAATEALPSNPVEARASLKDRLASGEGFRDLDVLRAYIDSGDEDVTPGLRGDGGFLANHEAQLTPAGRLLVHINDASTARPPGWRVAEPRTMETLGRAGETDSLEAAMTLATALEQLGFPWNGDPKDKGRLTRWRSPEGFTILDEIARIRAEWPDLLDKTGAWARQVAARRQANNPASLVAVRSADARALLGAFTRVPGGPQWKLQGRDEGRFTGNVGSAAVAVARKLTDAEFAQRQARLDRVISDAYPKHATDVTHRDTSGAWLPERDALHRDIADQFYAEAADVPADGVAVVAGGLMGAGKTTVLRDHAGINPGDYITISPDDVKEEMARRGLVPEIPGHPDLSPMERSALIHVESGRVAGLVADAAYRDRRNLIWDITLRDSDWARQLVDKLRREYGYNDVRSVFVDIPVATSMERALHRHRHGQDEYAAGKGLGGRFVPMRLIEGQATPDGGSRNRQVFETVKDIFDSWSLYDNSVFGRAPRLVDKSGVMSTAARSLLDAFTRVPGGPQWKLQGRKEGRFTGNVVGVGGAAHRLTDVEFDARQARVDAAVAGAFPALATHTTHTDGSGAWLPERDVLHRAIAAEMYAKARDVPTDGRAVLAGGPPGAGKTTVLRGHADVDTADYLTVAADDMKEELARRGLVPEIPGYPDLSPMERSALVHKESQRIAQLIADMAYHDRRNVIWDASMSTDAFVTGTVGDLRRHGYDDVRAVFVDIPVDVSIERALDRYRQGADDYLAGTGLGGRYLPPRVIEELRTPGGSTKNREIFEAFKDAFDRWSVYDNSVFGRAPRLVAESTSLLDMAGRR